LSIAELKHNPNARELLAAKGAYIATKQGTELSPVKLDFVAIAGSQQVIQTPQAPLPGTKVYLGVWKGCYFFPRKLITWPKPIHHA
jgi:hypothetical protein